MSFLAAKKMLLVGGRKPGQIAFTTAGSFQWRCPPGVRLVCVVCVGPGGWVNSNGDGGGGGGLGWKNNIAVTPGQTYLVFVGGLGEDSYFIDPSVVCGRGARFRTGGGFVGDGGGRGGDGGGFNPDYQSSAGGGAGGYRGNGSNAFASNDGGSLPGQGGAGSGGNLIGGGGGVGLLGEGASGAGVNSQGGGRGGSGGADGRSRDASGNPFPSGGDFGGGAGFVNNRQTAFGRAGVRLIWGKDRAFPATRTGDL